MGGAGSPGSGLDLLLNHTHAVNSLNLHQWLATYSVAHGTPYVIGETNSLSGHGQDGASNVHGAALWGRKRRRGLFGTI